MNEFELFHNPRCSKSRAALQLLRDLGIEPTVRLYLESPPEPAELQTLLRRLDCPISELVRTGETVFRELGLAIDSIDAAMLFEAMSVHPILIQRPILVRRERAVIGRPPERVLELLEPRNA